MKMFSISPSLLIILPNGGVRIEIFTTYKPPAFLIFI